MDDSYCYVGDILGYKYIVENFSLNKQEERVNKLITFVECYREIPYNDGYVSANFRHDRGHH